MKEENKKIMERLEVLEAKLDKILIIIESQKISCDKMSDHIDFVEAVIQKYMRNPLIKISSFYKQFLTTSKNDVTEENSLK